MGSRSFVSFAVLLLLLLLLLLTNTVVAVGLSLRPPPLFPLPHTIASLIVLVEFLLMLIQLLLMNFVDVVKLACLKLVELSNSESVAWVRTTIPFDVDLFKIVDELSFGIDDDVAAAVVGVVMVVVILVVVVVAVVRD